MKTHHGQAQKAIQTKSDVLLPIAEGVKEELEKHGLFNLTIQSRNIKGRGYRIELVATREFERSHAMIFKILFEGDKLRLVDDGFDIEAGDFNRRERTFPSQDFHTFSDYEYADPSMLDDLFLEIKQRFVDGT